MRCTWMLALLLATPSFAAVDTLHVRSGVYDVAWAAESDSTASVTVVERRSSRKVFASRLTEVFAGHYHPAEYHNGHLYAIRRTGDYRRVPDTWTDELWRYQGNERRTRLFEGRGLDFRVAPNDSVIVVRRSSLILASTDGSVIRTFSASDLRLDYIGPLWISNRFVFVASGGPGAGLDRLVRIGLRDSGLTVFEFPELGIDADSDFDPELQMVVGSDHPFFYDAESGEEWKYNHPVVTLRLYDLVTRTSTTIATSVAEWFQPRWVGDGVFEFTDPKSGRRVTWSVGQGSGRPR